MIEQRGEGKTKKTILICDECEEEHDVSIAYGNNYQVQIASFVTVIKVVHLDLCKKCGDQKFKNAMAKRAAAEVLAS